MPRPSVSFLMSYWHFMQNSTPTSVKIDEQSINRRNGVLFCWSPRKTQTSLLSDQKKVKLSDRGCFSLVLHMENDRHIALTTHWYVVAAHVYELVFADVRRYWKIALSDAWFVMPPSFFLSVLVRVFTDPSAQAYFSRVRSVSLSLAFSVFLWKVNRR